MFTVLDLGYVGTDNRFSFFLLLIWLWLQGDMEFDGNLLKP